jgi:flagellar protein FlbD
MTPERKSHIAYKRTELVVISLTRLNNSSLIINSDLIKFVEQSPDTVITLVNGEKILVRESVDEVMQRYIDFRRTLLQGPIPMADRTPAGEACANPHSESLSQGKR